jgi:peptide/nickel transport system permease protein
MTWSYLVRRFAWSVAALWAATTITFLIAYGIPQDPAAVIAGPRATPQLMAEIDRALGLDRPLALRYLLYLWHLAHGSLGYSYILHQPVAPLVGRALEATLVLTAFALTFELVLGISLGLLADRFRGGAVDAAVRVLTVTSLSLPAYWVGIAALSFLAFRLGWFPLGGYSLRGALLPALAVAVPGSAYYARLLRSSLERVWGEDYARTAVAKGLSPARVLLRHVVRNALVPVATYFGIDLANLLSGLIIVEVVFDWPGLGMLTNQGIGNLDGSVIMAVTLVAAAAVILANFLTDVVYLWLDPRIEYR